MTDHDDDYGYLLDMVQRKSLVEKLAEKRKEFLRENYKLSEIAKPIHSPNDDIDYEELFNILDDISDDQDVDEEDKEDVDEKDVDEKDVEEKDDELNEDELLEKELEAEIQEYKKKLYNMDEKQFNNLCVREKLLNDFFRT